MARLPFPDAGSRKAETQDGKPAVNKVGTVYLDAAGTQLADIRQDNGGSSGAAYAGSQVTTDAYGFLPFPFWGPTGDVDRLYITVNGGPLWPIDADNNARLDAVANTANAAETPSGAQAKADAAQSAAIAAASADATGKANAAQAASAQRASNLADLASLATARANLNAAQRMFYDVRDYGARGDGVTDDTASIQAAFAACATAGRGTVYFPDGTYLTHGVVVQGMSNFTVRGDRGAVLWIAPGTPASPTQGTRNILTVADCTNFSIVGLAVDARRDTIAADQLLGATISAGATSVTVADGSKFVVGEKFSIIGGYSISGGAERNRRDEMRTVTGIAGNVLTFTPATGNAYTAGAGGAYVTRYQTGSSAQVAGRNGNLAGENQQNGIHLIGCTRFQIRGCTARNVWESPIKMGTGFEASSGFYGQTITGVGGYTGPADGCSYGTVADNVGTHGLDQGVSVWLSEQITVTGNVISDAGWAGVSLTQSYDCTVTGNICSDQFYRYANDVDSGTGLAVEGGARNILSGNVCRNNHARGIFFNWDPMNWGITPATPPTLGAAAAKGSTTLTVSSSTAFVAGCYYSLYDGARSEQVKVVTRPDSTHLTVAAPTRYRHSAGVELGSPIAEDNIIVGNSISGSATQDAILLNSAVRSIVENNTIVGNYGAAIQMPLAGVDYGSTLKIGAHGSTVRGNTMVDNGAGTNVATILVGSVAEVDVVGNTIVGSRASGGGGHGIDVQGLTDGRVTGNRVSDCGNAGIMVETGSGVTPRSVLVADNITTRNGNEGIIATAGTGLRVRGNTCTSNGANGLDLRGVTRSVVDGNVCTGNNTKGIQLQNCTNIQVTRNVVRDDGFGINPATGAAQTQALGIDETGTSDFNTITGNQVDANTTSQITTVGTHTGVYGNNGDLPIVGRTWKSGSRYAPQAINLGTGAPNLNEVRYIPVLIPNAVTLTEIAAEITTVGSVGATARLILAAAGADGRPGTVLLCTAALAATATGKISQAISQAVTPGRYFLGLVAQGAPVTVPIFRTISGVPEMYEQPTLPNYLRCGYSVYGQTGLVTGIGGLSMDSADGARVEVLVG